MLTVLAGALAVTGGPLGSFQWDTPWGPSVVVVAVVLFALGLGCVDCWTRAAADFSLH